MLQRVRSTLLLAAVLVLCSVLSLFIGVVNFSVSDVLNGNWEALEILVLSRLPPAVGNFMHRNGHERRGSDHAAAVHE